MTRRRHKREKDGELSRHTKTIGRPSKGNPHRRRRRERKGKVQTLCVSYNASPRTYESHELSGTNVLDFLFPFH